MRFVKKTRTIVSVKDARLKTNIEGQENGSGQGLTGRIVTFLFNVRRFSRIFCRITLQEFKLLHPVVSKHDRERQKKQRDWEKQALLEQFDEVEVIKRQLNYF